MPPPVASTVFGSAIAGPVQPVEESSSTYSSSDSEEGGLGVGPGSGSEHPDWGSDPEEGEPFWESEKEEGEKQAEVVVRKERGRSAHSAVKEEGEKQKKERGRSEKQAEKEEGEKQNKERGRSAPSAVKAEQAPQSRGSNERPPLPRRRHSQHKVQLIPRKRKLDEARQSRGSTERPDNEVCAAKAPPSIMPLRPKARAKAAPLRPVSLRPRSSSPNDDSGPAIAGPEYQGGTEQDIEALVSGMPEARLNLAIGSLLLDRSADLKFLKDVVLGRGDGLIFISWVPDAVTTPYEWHFRKAGLCALIRDVQDIYAGLLLGEGYLVVLWRRNRVAKVVTLDRVLVVSQGVHEARASECEHTIAVFRADILGNDHNAEACRRHVAVEVAAVFRLGGAHLYAQWNSKMVDALQNLVLLRHVRVLVGFFDCEVSQLQGLLRSCGASGGEPISQPFQSNWPAQAGEPSVIVHPHYAVVFGPAQIRTDPAEEQPTCPVYLESGLSQSRGCEAGLARFAVSSGNRPIWKNIPWVYLMLGGAHPEQMRLVFGCSEEWDFLVWPHLNKVVSKKTDITKWHRDIHVVQLWINAKNKKSGKGARQRKAQKKQKAR